ncbi:MAG TPA: MMPL family transporter [Streptosporangiaceae bacterium]|nr:MMPL family transporter [Streptosporangiaceae bacterium]
MRSVARWCYQHRFLVLGAWIVVLAAAFFGASSTGSNYAAGTQLSGTPSAQAAALLQRAAPSVSGDTETIVFQAKTGHVTDPAVRTQIQQMLARVSHLRYVGSITSPYTAAGAKQISASGTIAFAQVNFTKADTAIPSAEATQLVNLARAPNSPHLQVDVVGSVAASTNPAPNYGTFIGVGAALIVLLIVFGAVIPALLPLIGTGIALFAALSVIGMLSKSIAMASFTPQLCTLIGLGVGIDYSLFILTRVRSGIRRGLSVEQAVVTAAGTAGRAVLFAGITVCVALLGMLTVGVSVLSGAAIAASIAVLFPMMAAQTLLPALVRIVGKRTLTRRQRAALARGETDVPEASRRWLAWARRVEAHRVMYAIGVLSVLVALGLPFFSMRQGSADYSTNPTSTTTTTYRAYEMLAQGFGPGFSGPLQLVAAVNGPADQAAFASVVSAAAHTPGVVATAGPQLLPAGPGHPAVEVANVYPTGSPQDASTAALIGTMRGTVIPGTLHASGSRLDVLVGGQTALSTDFAGQLSAKLPMFVAVVVALSFILLMTLFRSLVIPATAAVMNLFSAAAAFGVIVAVFQFGWLDQLVGVTHTGPITPLVPILMFAVLFGLSMDYEVFLVSRMHEEWLKLRDNDAAVRIGQAITGKTISAAAAIMIVVFSSFVITTDRTIKMIGLGMAVAILIDALLIRTVLVPAVMHTFGRYNWALPAFLDRRLPRLSLEAGDPAGETPAARPRDRVTAP